MFPVGQSFVQVHLEVFRGFIIWLFRIVYFDIEGFINFMIVLMTEIDCCFCGVQFQVPSIEIVMYCLEIRFQYFLNFFASRRWHAAARSSA